MLRINSKEYRCRVVGIRNCESAKLFVPVSKFNTLLYTGSKLGGNTQKTVINTLDYLAHHYLEIGAMSSADVLIALKPEYDWISLEFDLLRDTNSVSTIHLPFYIKYN